MSREEIEKTLRRFGVLVENQEQLIIALSEDDYQHPYKVVARSPLTHHQWKKKQYVDYKNFARYSPELIERWILTRDITVFKMEKGEWQLIQEYSAKCKGECQNCHMTYYKHECER